MSSRGTVVCAATVGGVTFVRRLRGRVLILAMCVVCAACSSSKPSAPATVTVTASAPGGSGSSARTPGSPASSSPRPTPTTSLRGTCDSVLPSIAVDQAVGVTIVGRTAFIVNEPDRKAGQVRRLNCRYGIAAVRAGSKQTDTKVEVSISLYATDAQAASRVSGTEQEWRGQGAVPHAVRVAGHAATILTGYGKPLLVVADGPRTVAVTLASTVVSAARLDAALTAVAASALRGSGG